MVGCSRCGPVVVDPAMVEVHANPGIDLVLHAFLCPRCGSYEVGGCRETGAELVARGAVRYELRSTDDPPFTVDDVIDLHAWLATDPTWPVTW